MARPNTNKVRDAFTGRRRLVLEVFIEESKIGPHRGNLTKATRAVATARRIKYEALKRAVSRYRSIRLIADILTGPLRAVYDKKTTAEQGAEIEQRMRGIPDDVREALLEA